MMYFYRSFTEIILVFHGNFTAIYGKFTEISGNNLIKMLYFGNLRTMYGHFTEIVWKLRKKSKEIIKNHHLRWDTFYYAESRQGLEFLIAR